MSAVKAAAVAVVACLCLACSSAAPLSPCEQKCSGELSGTLCLEVCECASDGGVFYTLGYKPGSDAPACKLPTKKGGGS